MWLYKFAYFLKIIRYRLFISFDRYIIDRRLINSPKKTVDITKIKSILIFRKCGIGDMVITTPMIRALAQNGYQVSILAPKTCLVILQNNPYVKETFVWSSNPSTLKALSEEICARQFDLIIDLCYPSYVRGSFHLNTICNSWGAKYTLGWNKSRMNFYDICINHYTRKDHFIELIKKILARLDIQDPDLSYEFFLTPETEQKAKTFIEAIHQLPKSPIIVLNPYASHKSRDMTEHQIRETISLLSADHPQAQFVLIGFENRITPLIERLAIPDLMYYPSKSILDLLPLIQLSDLVISPDTSIVHIAAAYQKPLVALYVSSRRTPLKYATPKDRVKDRYHALTDHAKAIFFDKPNLLNKKRPFGKLFLTENWFGPNNPKAIQLKTLRNSLAFIPTQDIVNAANQLLNKNQRTYTTDKD